jgi:hypothetical protein
MKTIQKAKRKGKKITIPMWRCAVCGRADMPYIACYVVPFLVLFDDSDD